MSQHHGTATQSAADSLARETDGCVVRVMIAFLPNTGSSSQQVGILDALSSPPLCFYARSHRAVVSSNLSMVADPNALADFRRELSHLRTAQEARWDASRKLVEAARAPHTLGQLVSATQQSSLSDSLKDRLVHALGRGGATRIQDLPGDLLKELTGLPPTKAVRALCVLFGLVESAVNSYPVSQLTPTQVEQLVCHHRNPFDVLLDADVASVLDLGAGDLSFAAELAKRYGPSLRSRDKRLCLHCVDRLSPGSMLGGPLHPDATRLADLRSRTDMEFRFYGDCDMFDLDRLEQDGRLAPRYTIVTCWAPATPTFAYEPTRLSQELIHEDLRKTKGTFRLTRVNGEKALEVQHGERSLLFPPWKFEIRGPLALLDLLSRRGSLGILGAVDGQVFWELLSQLLADPRYRPDNTLFTPALLPTIFGEVHRRMTQLPLGSSLNLADIAELRGDLPRLLEPSRSHASSHRFRHVEIRRGAVFNDIPASSTARLFKNMAEESPPWFVILVPESLPDPAK